MFSAPTSQVVWSDVAIQINDGLTFATWKGVTTNDLTSVYPPITHNETYPEYLGDLEVYLSITDLSGNGLMSNGDFITITLPSGQSFDSGTTYTLTLMYEPTGGQMTSYHF